MQQLSNTTIKCSDNVNAVAGRRPFQFMKFNRIKMFCIFGNCTKDTQSYMKVYAAAAARASRHTVTSLLPLRCRFDDHGMPTFGECNSLSLS